MEKISTLVKTFSLQILYKVPFCTVCTLMILVLTSPVRLFNTQMTQPYCYRLLILTIYFSFNRLSNQFSTYFANLDLSMNTNKSDVLIFGTKINQITFMDNLITPSQSTKFLGVYLQSNKQFITHNEHMVNCINAHFLNFLVCVTC